VVLMTERVVNVKDISDGVFAQTAWREYYSAHSPTTLWEDCDAVEAWVIVHGAGRYYWRIQPKPEEGRWRLEFLFSDPDTAVAFRIRWG
jgi:hypothetical protein